LTLIWLLVLLLTNMGEKQLCAGLRLAAQKCGLDFSGGAFAKRPNEIKRNTK